ncbi:hypothetical protein ACLF3G_28180 [Falsiroseomonas sp. HC035]|uniref:hypothetical protein n=1 Tax=Falsiroseomonas sp. HC035 TaxID=3390999 RepID=UPI003D3154CA
MKPLQATENHLGDLKAAGAEIDQPPFASLGRAPLDVTTSALRMADGTGRAVTRQPRHPDPLVEAVRRSVSEGAVLQAIGRSRGVRRTATRPVRVVVLAALALPLTVHENPTWEEYRPSRLAAATAEAALFLRALPLAPEDMVTARPDRWESERTARRNLADWDFKAATSLMRGTYKADGRFKCQTVARYRRPGARRWSIALVPIEGGRDALEQELECAVAAFEVVPEPALTPSRKPAEAPAPRLMLPPATRAPARPLLVARARLDALSRRLEAAFPIGPGGALAVPWRGKKPPRSPDRVPKLEERP